ncbi:MAG: FG-GAP-like repeat-containing protein [Bacteroidota bacterium]
MKFLNTFFILVLIPIGLFSQIIQNDNGKPGGSYAGTRVTWEESVLLKPDGPCKIKKIMIHLSGDNPGLDTIMVCGDPSDGGLPPTEFVWHYNLLIDQLIVDYDGNPGWYEFDVSETGLRADGFDRICIQHNINEGGPYFTYDDNGAEPPVSSYLCDALTPNPDFYNIAGTLFFIPAGDFMVRMEVEYDRPDGRGSSLPPPPPTMNDVSVQAGLTDAEGKPVSAAIASAADINGDGWDDVIIGSRVYINQKDGTFRDKSDLYVLKNSAGQGFSGTVWADVDNDGYMDCFGVRGNGGDAILYGSASGTMTIGNNPEVVLDQPTVTPMWFDYDGDGLLDLFIAYGRKTVSGQEVYYQDKLFHNLGNRRFENLTPGSGIDQAEQSPYYDCWGASIGDYNNDLRPDPFVATYRLAPDLLYNNLGDGTFDEVGEETGVRGNRTDYPDYFGHGMGSDWADFDNDGDFDLAVGNLGHPDSRGLASNPSLIFSNNGAPDYNFTEVHQAMGLKFFEMNAGIVWADLDLDGWQDLFHCQYAYYKRGEGNDKLSRLYINGGQGEYFRLADRTWQTGAEIHGAWSPIRLDYDNDGDMDLLIASSNEYVKLFRNDMERRGNWASFRIEGSPENGVPPEGFGASISVEAGGRTFHRALPGVVMTARASQNSNELHFGLGDAEKIDRITVRYPNGEIFEAENIDINNKYIIPYKQAPEIYTLAAPALKYPHHLETGVPMKTKLEWHKISEAESYMFKVYEAGQSDPLSFGVNNFPDNTASSEIEFPHEGIYYYEVEAISMTESSTSSRWYFMVGEPTASAPQLISPEHNDFPVSIVPRFEWSESEYESFGEIELRYDLQISTDENFVNIIDSAYSLNSTSYKYEDTLRPDSFYNWRVRGVLNGVPGEWSLGNVFRTIPMPAMTLLRSPTVGDTTAVKPEFHWDSVMYADVYDIQVATDENFENIAKEFSGISATKFRFFPAFDGGTKYYWRVRAGNEAGHGEWSPVWHFFTEGESSVMENGLPQGFSIGEAVPNPMQTSGEIEIALPRAAWVKLELLDLSGTVREVFADGEISVGAHSISFNTSNLESGIYYCRMSAGGGAAIRKIIIQK